MGQDIARTQKRLLEMAKTIKDILEANNINYIITYGTLIGAVRHKGFIPWDDDFDFILFDDEYPRAMEILRDQLPSDMFLEDEKSEPLFFHAWAHVKDKNSIVKSELYPQDNIYRHQGLMIDLYRAVRMKSSETALYRLKQNLLYRERLMKSGFISNERYLELKKEIESEIDKMDKCTCESETEEYVVVNGPNMDVDEVFPLVRYSFEGVLFWGPNQYDSLLRKSYGDYLTLPPEEKRHPHYTTVTFLD